MKLFWLVISASFAVLGCIIGAGFISGTEIYLFFAKYGAFGIVLSIVSILSFIMTVIFMSHNHSILQKNDKKQQILSICQIFISGTMFAGLSSILQSFGILSVWANIIILLILSIVLYLGISFASKLNVVVGLFCTIIVPASIFISGVQLNIAGVNNSLLSGLSGFIFAVLYTFMNIVCGMPVIMHIASRVSKKTFLAITIIVGAILLFLQVLIMCVVFPLNQENMPMLTAISGPAKSIYLLLLVFAIASSLVSSGMGAKNFCGQGHYISYNFVWSIIVACIIMLTSFIGFTNIIKITYPIVGLVLFLTTILPVIVSKVKLRHKK